MSKRVEYVHLARAVAWACFGIYVLAFSPTLRQSITVLFILSVAACVESALGNWSARRAERVADEEGPQDPPSSEA